MGAGRVASAGVGAVAESLARLDAGVSWAGAQAGVDGRAGWVRCADLLADPDAIGRWQREAAAVFGGADDDGLLTGQGLVLDWYLAGVVLPAVGMFHVDRRVPGLAPEDVHLLPGSAGSPVAATALDSAQFRCLVDDPAADGVDAEVVDGLDALAAALRTELLAHADRLIEAYAPTTRIGSHGLWGAVTDAVDVAAMTGGWVSGEPARAADDARLVLTGDPRWVGGSTLHEIDDARGRRHWTRRRYSCCFLYRAPGAGVCVTCPRVSDEERRRQAAHW